MTENKQSRRPGRPPLPDTERKSGSNITFRARSDLRERLSNSASLANRSLSEEVEHRLSLSFTERDIIARAYGGEGNADFIKALGIGLQFIQAKIGERWTHPDVETEVIVMLAKLIRERFCDGQEAWAHLVSDAERGRANGIGAQAGDIALSVLNWSPRRPIEPIKI